MTPAGGTPRAVPCRAFSDAMLIDRRPDGELRCRRADDPAREEYSYRKPFILELEITRRCNLQCVHCYAQAADTPFPDELTLSEIRTVLRDGAELGIRELSLTGGEVFLRPDFIPILDAGLDAGFALRFVTNATLLTDALLAELCRRPVKLITVSLDGISAAAHERIRGPGSHEPALRHLLRLKDAGFCVSVITAFSRLNLGEFDALLEFCVRHRLNWQVQMTSAKGRCDHRITLTPDEYYALGEKVAAAHAAGWPIRIIPMDDLATFSHFPPLSRLAETWQGQCTGGLLNLFVRANGDVTPCSALCFPECIAGNVRRDSLLAICREERCRRVLAWMEPRRLTGVCADCGFLDECRGGCPEILISMCKNRTENEYCYHRVEQQRILAEIA